MTSDMDDLTQHNPPNKNFAIIFNEVLRDPRLTAAEAGILCRLLSHVEGWRFNADRLAAEWPGLSKRGAVAAMRGLRNHGYIHRVVTHAGTRRIRTELHLFSTSTPVCGLHGCQDCATRAEAETQFRAVTQLRGQVLEDHLFKKTIKKTISLSPASAVGSRPVSERPGRQTWERERFKPSKGRSSQGPRDR